MSVLYSELKSTAQILYGDSIDNGFVEADSGSPTELSLLFSLVHNRIVGAPREWDFCKRDVTITLTGATTYNLRTLFEDYLGLFQVYGIYENAEYPYYPNYEANITPADGYTVKNGVLSFTGNVPSTGTLRAQIKSGYLVENSAGTRQKYFTDDTDVSVVPFGDMNVLIFGIGNYIQWKTDEVSKEKRNDVKDWFTEAWKNMFDRNEVTRQLTSML